jgi:transcriptional regulator with XRE-family HTH domain
MFSTFQHMQTIELSQKLTTRRTELGLTQQYVADLAGITRRLLSEWEAGRGNPGFRQLNQVIDVLGLQLSVTNRIIDETR